MLRPSKKEQKNNIILITYRYRAYSTQIQKYKSKNWFYILYSIKMRVFNKLSRRLAKPSERNVQIGSFCRSSDWITYQKFCQLGQNISSLDYL